MYMFGTYVTKFEWIGLSNILKKPTKVIGCSQTNVFYLSRQVVLNK